jgi:hypothetical protein
MGQKINVRGVPVTVHGDGTVSIHITDIDSKLLQRVEGQGISLHDWLTSIVDDAKSAAAATGAPP